MADNEYATRIGVVAEILRPPPITEVPRALRHVLGICSVRGRLVTVIDGRRRLGLPGARPGRQARILVIDAGDGEFIGIMVDAVLRVHRLSPAEIEPASHLDGEQPAHLIGIGRPQDSQTAPSEVRGNASGTIVLIVDLGLLVRGER